MDLRARDYSDHLATLRIWIADLEVPCAKKCQTEDCGYRVSLSVRTYNIIYACYYLLNSVSGVNLKAQQYINVAATCY